jgi:hypothetical protein
MATQPDYYIATIDTTQGHMSWRWELRRHSKPMGVIVGRNGYQSQAAAEYAGKRELEHFLNALAKEERRTRLSRQLTRAEPFRQERGTD